MSKKMYNATAAAMVKLFRPLVRILLRNNITCGIFYDLFKWVYVDVALKEFTAPDKKQSVSHASIITGLSRKDVKRLKEISQFEDISVSERQNRAVRVISGWLYDPRFLDKNGTSKELPFDGGKISFTSLVKAYSGDVPPRTMLDEMLRVELVDVCNKQIRLLTKGYIIKEGEVEKLSMLGVDVGELISTISHNIVCDPSEIFLQRKTMYDNIPEDALLELRGLISKMGTDFIKSMDKLISKYDRDANPFVKGKGRKKVGLGIFYFE